MSASRARLLREVTDESRRHYAAYTLFNQALADHMGLHPTDLQCLGLLALETRPMTTGRIAQLSGLTPGSATRLVDRLEQAGFVARENDPDDRRRSLVRLLPRPGAEVAEAWDVPGRAFDEAMAEFSDDELAVVAAYLRRLSAVGNEQAARLVAERPARSPGG
ncbi:DNA-binding MarR family transcriptional regulator [Murinocardiopsis flavida]|uniref:DNA-binding MarR family transcriptional regulator n=1 Tax=Murinocardiopsis flavida TaxID=645275 RepID=A0A2P8DJC5_9ACTN|nr:MarR family transcriptional regulator [Murinocardiopsis flavida]PSK97333.1 DNA-binding MarR family transcriptional regulator [Murinocardiopsis flavida]